MNASNGRNEQTIVKEFIIVAFPGSPEKQIVYFIILFLIFFLTVTANTTIIVLVWLDRYLHTPMYFFLGNFSFLEIMYVTTAIPKLLEIFLTHNHTISFSACLTQMYVFTVLGINEVLYLLNMSYDRYLAICCPLRYATIMTLRYCIFLVLGCWSVALFFASFHLILVANLPFCGPRTVDHFLCEPAPLFKLSCSDITFIKTFDSILASIVILSSFLFTLVSYTYVIVTIIRMPSDTGKQKAFSTCTSHLTVVIIFFLTVSVMYVKPSEKEALRNKVTAVIYIIVIPCLNPFIYSLKNKDMKEALRKVLSRRKGAKCT